MALNFYLGIGSVSIFMTLGEVEELHGSQVARSTVNQHRIRASQRMCAELGRVETNARHPLLHQPSVLSCRQSDSVATP